VPALFAISDLIDLVFRAGLFAGIASFFVLALLIPLYMQQARDVRRLREWAALAPDRETAEFQAAESAGVATLPPPPVTGVRRDTAPMPPVPASQRVSRELPAAIRRGTTETSLATESRWRRFLRRPDPRWLIGIVLGVVVLGVGVGVFAVNLREDGSPSSETSSAPPAVDPADVDVAVLNATQVPGLAAKVGDDLASGGFVRGAVGNSDPAPESSVLYERGFEAEAEAVAERLGIDIVEVIDEDTEQNVAEASEATGLEPAAVVVVAGEDRVVDGGSPEDDQAAREP
jgi:hypothetical protein